MSRKATGTYLENTVGLLVDHFGMGPVRSALAKVSHETAAVESHSRQRHEKPDRQIGPSITVLMERLRDRDPEKVAALAGFYARVRNGSVLPESQDIRFFAQLIGVKEVTGKSRKEMIPKLMRALIERPIERLRQDIEAAASISDQQRKQGFSVLTDKIMSGVA